MVADNDDTYIRYNDKLATTIGFTYMLKHLDIENIPIVFNDIVQPKQVLKVSGRYKHTYIHTHIYIYINKRKKIIKMGMKRLSVDFKIGFPQ